MWPFSRPKRSLEDPRSKRFMALEDHIEGLEARVEKNYAELKALRGLVHAIRAKEPIQDAPGPTNGDEEVRGHPRAVRSLRGW